MNSDQIPVTMITRSQIWIKSVARHEFPAVETARKVFCSLRYNGVTLQMGTMIRTSCLLLFKPQLQFHEHSHHPLQHTSTFALLFHTGNTERHMSPFKFLSINWQAMQMILSLPLISPECLRDILIFDWVPGHAPIRQASTGLKPCCSWFNACIALHDITARGSNAKSPVLGFWLESRTQKNARGCTCGCFYTGTCCWVNNNT